MNAPFIGSGVLEALASADSGEVIATFDRAVYIDVLGNVFALVTPGVHRGPLHLGVDGSLDAVSLKAAVKRSAGRLLIGGGACVDYRHAVRWSGSLPGTSEVRNSVHLVMRGLASLAQKSALLDALYGQQVESAVEAVKAGDVVQAVSDLAGLGPGLTPAGDDALAGILLSARALWGEPAEPYLRSALSRARTSLLSRSFLRWAAWGQTAAPVHALLDTAARGERAGVERAVTQLASIGASSGSDLALGVSIGLETLPRRPAGC